MKKFCVLAAISAAMFLMISCGGSSDGNVENDGNKVCTDYYKNGTCNGHNADLCVEGEKTWYEVEGTDKKFYCDENGVCTEANQKLAEYCTGGNGGNNGDTQNNDDPDDPEDDGKDNGDYEDGGDTDNEGGDYFCLDVQQCDDGALGKFLLCKSRLLAGIDDRLNYGVLRLKKLVFRLEIWIFKRACASGARFLSRERREGHQVRCSGQPRSGQQKKYLHRDPERCEQRIPPGTASRSPWTPIFRKSSSSQLSEFSTKIVSLDIQKFDEHHRHLADHTEKV